MLPPEAAIKGDSDWFVRDRFGMFITWGLYAMGARHEWLQHHDEMSTEAYAKYFRHFNPDLYDPALWAEAAADAGMKYFVVTTKHHEGFCLWDSALTDFKSTNTPARRDLIAPMVDAFRDRGLRVGLYHSLIDWHHPHYQIDPHIGPLRADAQRDALNAQRDHDRYVAYLHGQVEELLTRFGKVDVMWLDYSFPKPDGSGKGREAWKSEALVRLIRRLQPNVLLNDRLDLDWGWDFKTPEQYVPQHRLCVQGAPVIWEACHTFSGSWGYHRDEQTWKSVEQLVRLLIDTVSKGGNLLLNVGPTGRGEIDERALSRLASMGRWLRRHERSIYGCTAAPDEFVCPQDCRLTWNPQTRRLYVHVFAWPFRHIHLQHLAGRVDYAQMVHDGSEILLHAPPPEGVHWGSREAGSTPDLLTLAVPVVPPDVPVPVIELILK